MPPLKFFSGSYFSKLAKVICPFFFTLFFSINIQANQFEITPMIGYNFSPDLINNDFDDSLSTSNEPSFSIAFSWQDSASGQGQILINYIDREFIENENTHSFDTLYTHFNGVSLIKDNGYTTTVSLGVGTTYFKSDFDKVIAPSLTFAVGTRHEFSENLAFITEFRGYATLVDDDDTIFCENDNCIAYFKNSVWFDTQLSIGLAYRF